jgi:lipopolysaccharide/colanic/teichoic acid biosynthesis glycosyltransferase
MQHTHDYILVYQMKPGLTSEATLYNGYTDTIEKMLKRLDMDIRYLENRTLMLDLKIILSTVYGMLKSLPLAGTNGKAGKKTNSIS